MLNYLHCIFLCCSIASVVAIRQTAPSPLNLTSPSCPKNQFGKKEPSKENDLPACKQYACNGCCGRNITEQLAQFPLTQIGNLNFEQCNMSLSSACSTQTTFLECFYQCSPNLFPWIQPSGKLRHIPLCAKFCDSWFAACQMDMTCVVGSKGSWFTLQTGFNDDGTPKDPCTPGSACRSYNDVYQTPENLCNNLWGDLFVYTEDKDKCVDPSNPQHNAEVVKQAGEAMGKQYITSDCSSQSVNYTDTGMIIGIVFGVLGALFLIAAGVAYYMNTKKDKDYVAGQKGPTHTEEMTVTKSANTSSKANPETPPNTRDQSDVEEA